MPPLKRKSSADLRKAELPRDFNGPGEVQDYHALLGYVKSRKAIGNVFYQGLLAGFFVAAGGLVGTSVAGGLSGETHVILPKLGFGLFFPIALMLIVLFGGELFTGNQMILTVAYLNKAVEFKDLLMNWIVVYISNFLGCAASAYFFSYLTEFYTDDPWYTYVHSVALKKMHYGFGALFLRGIFANSMVCLAVFQAMESREISGKILAMWPPIMCFAIVGGEHCVANMFLLSQSAFYGTPGLDAREFARIIGASTLGNIIGGAGIVGFSEYFIYHWFGAHKHDGDHVHEYRRLWPCGRKRDISIRVAAHTAPPPSQREEKDENV